MYEIVVTYRVYGDSTKYEYESATLAEIQYMSFVGSFAATPGNTTVSREEKGKRFSDIYNAQKRLTHTIIFKEM